MEESPADFSGYEAAQRWARLNNMHPDFPYNMAGRVSLCFVDEAHNSRNIDSTFHYAIRGLDAEFHILLTATPVPWSVQGYGGLLALMQDPKLDDEAAKKLGDVQLKDPYKSDARPEDKKYASTYTAFRTFVKTTDSLTQHSKVLRTLWDQHAHRISYNSTCETHVKGDFHCLQNLLPNYVAVRITVENTPTSQNLYDMGMARIDTPLWIHDPSLKRRRINGNVMRRITLGTFDSISISAFYPGSWYLKTTGYHFMSCYSGTPET